MKYIVMKRLFEKSAIYEEGGTIELTFARAAALGDYVKPCEERVHEESVKEEPLKDEPMKEEKTVRTYSNKMIQRKKYNIKNK